MLLILDESLAQELEVGGQYASTVLSALRICAQQALEGVHILYAERGVYRRIHAFHSSLDGRTGAALSRAEARLPQMRQMRDFSRVALRLVAASDEGKASRVAREGRIEVVLPATMVVTQSALVGRPILMVENLIDGRFFLRLVQSLVGQGPCSEWAWLGALRLECELVPGGGQSLSDVFRYHKVEGRRIGLAVCDSDMRSPNASRGPTAEALMVAVGEGPSSVLLEAYVLDQRAVENYIPRAELLKQARDLDPAQFYRVERLTTLFGSSPFWRFIPIKGGIKCFELDRTTAESKFWTALFGHRLCDGQTQCSTKRFCQTFILHPVSTRLIQNAIDADRPLLVTEKCWDGMTSSWQQLITLVYSYFCGAERLVAL